MEMLLVTNFTANWSVRNDLLTFSVTLLEFVSVPRTSGQLISTAAVAVEKSQKCWKNFRPLDSVGHASPNPQTPNYKFTLCGKSERHNSEQKASPLYATT